ARNAPHRDIPMRAYFERDGDRYSRRNRGGGGQREGSLGTMGDCRVSRPHSPIVQPRLFRSASRFPVTGGLVGGSPRGSNKTVDRQLSRKKDGRRLFRV